MNAQREALVSRVADAARAATVARQRLLANTTQQVLEPLERERLRDLLESAERDLLAACALANQESL